MKIMSLLPKGVHGGFVALAHEMLLDGVDGDF
jgi:hypothetical protein